MTEAAWKPMHTHGSLFCFLRQNKFSMSKDLSVNTGKTKSQPYRYLNKMRLSSVSITSEALQDDQVSGDLKGRDGH